MKNESEITNRRTRVFVSSTFRDMMEERNVLMTHTWTELRRFCRERQAELMEVDLHCGIIKLEIIDLVLNNPEMSNPTGKKIANKVLPLLNRYSWLDTLYRLTTLGRTEFKYSCSWDDIKYRHVLFSMQTS